MVGVWRLAFYSNITTSLTFYSNITTSLAFYYKSDAGVWRFITRVMPVFGVLLHYFRQIA